MVAAEVEEVVVAEEVEAVVVAEEAVEADVDAEVTRPAQR